MHGVLGCSCCEAMGTAILAVLENPQLSFLRKHLYKLKGVVQQTCCFFSFATLQLKAAHLQVIGLGSKFDIKMSKDLFGNYLF